MKTMRILVADDQASFCQRMQEMTQSIPWASIVAEAKNGLEAIELVKQHRPGVVLMDIVMPGIERIRAKIGEIGLALSPF
jgi:chemotaxis response regulator CheB